MKKDNDEAKNAENKKAIESAIVRNNIPVEKCFQNQTGDFFVELETEGERDQLISIVTTSNTEMVVETPREIRHGITIVGLPDEYGKEEIIDMLMLQNGFIRQFAKSNDIHKHIKIHAVTSLKNKPSCFQAFGDVSSTLREGFHYFSNKVTLGLNSCIIYDRYDVKRCYNCHKFGQHAKDCHTKDEHVCGKCGDGHSTKECQSETKKCINCVRNNVTDVKHAASSHLCPSLVEQTNVLKKRNDKYLNYNRKKTILTT